MPTLQSLEAESLTCIRGGRLVFRDASFRVSAGEAMTVLGPNGSGKTSLLRILGGLLAQASGRVRTVSETGETSEAEDRRPLVGWFAHQDGIKAQLSPRENLRFVAKFFGADATAIEALLANVGLASLADLGCRYLSAGQRKRLALARLQLVSRPLWLLDEPFASLDQNGRSLAAQAIRGHVASGGIAIIATHDPMPFDCRTLSLA
ncbi:MAG TPA: heme ABC exporter ATP-binding protein CcmA [Rhizomicrobium sp.]|nr:heme ABC exporter ATP-binding protein CcmA [Rhizomicrobium sp.]